MTNFNPTVVASQETSEYPDSQLLEGGLEVSSDDGESLWSAQCMFLANNSSSQQPLQSSVLLKEQKQSIQWPVLLLWGRWKGLVTNVLFRFLTFWESDHIAENMTISDSDILGIWSKW